MRYINSLLLTYLLTYLPRTKSHFQYKKNCTARYWYQYQYRYCCGQ